MSKPTKHVCVHGHFYQPPRENPWLEAIEVQDSAAPYHDWNERITAECYAPNARARILHGDGSLARLANNYARMSFNFGPTLLSWMAGHAPEVLEAVVEGDRLGRQRYGGHGNALAQVYSHAILPLCSEADRRLQVRWGLADFRLRFGREPEGMWLAETAVDVPSLETLASEGLQFTILAPRQARRWREAASGVWQETPIDTTRPYWCELPSGRRIALFFYDGPVARAVAFEHLLNNGDRFADRLLGAFGKREGNQLAHIATDGESYGHHHRYGEMALAYTLEKLARLPDLRLTNYGQYLEENPPQHEVQIVENSSWSCVHGVERWRSDCGCNTGRGWHQKWRAPLRQALDELKVELDEVYLTRGKELLHDPQAALDEYVDVLLRHTPERLQAFLSRHCRQEPGGPEASVRCLRLLEMQRHSLLMFTSCGWFFDDVTGLETTQILMYAARAMQLCGQVAPMHEDLESAFLRRLAQAPSNVKDWGDAATYWRSVVVPAIVDLPRVLAHFGMSSLFEEARAPGAVYCYEVTELQEEREALGHSRLAVGRIAVRSRRTLETASATFAALYIDRLDMHCFLGRRCEEIEEEALRAALFECYRVRSVLDLYQMLRNEFPGRAFRLENLFTEEQRRIVRFLTEDRFEDYSSTLERMAARDDWLVQTLARLRHPIPKPMLAAVSLRVDRQLDALLHELHEPVGLERLRKLLKRSHGFGYQSDPWRVLERRIHELLERRLAGLEAADAVERELQASGLLLDAAKLLEVELHLWRVQNAFLRACRKHDEGEGTPELRAALERFAPRLGLTPQALPWHAGAS